MNIHTLGEAITANENGTIIDLWSLTDLFGAGRGKGLLLMYCPTAAYDGDVQMQEGAQSDLSDAASLGDNPSGTGLLLEYLQPTKRYIRYVTANRAAGSVSLYLLGAP